MDEKNKITVFIEKPRQNKVSDLILATSWQEGGVPFPMELMPFEIDRGQFFVADFGAGWIV